MFISTFLLPVGFMLAPIGCFMSVSHADVIKKVSFDKDCPQEKVKIVNDNQGMGSGSYKIDACGKKYQYEHAGTVVFESGQGPHQK